MKNCIIIHGCPGREEKGEQITFNKHWMPWLKEKLIAKGIKTQIPLMPEPWSPVYENFEKEFNKLKLNEETIIIGHSCGTSFLVNWLGKHNQKIDKLILVAPWKINDKEGDVKREEFYGFKINPEIKNQFNELIMFTSNDEDIEGKESLKLYSDELGGKIINLKDHGHYTLGCMGTEEFPELFEEVIKE